MNQNADRAILLGLLRAEPVTAATPAQWQAIVHLAGQHGVEGLLYRQLKTPGLTAQVPTDILQTLHSAYLRAASKNLRIYRELSGLFERLQRASIPGILLKGAYLLERVYGNVAARQMGDVDLLVKKSDLPCVAEIMEEMNFKCAHQLREAIEENCNFEWKHARHGLCVETHWDLIDSACGIHVDIDALWERSRAALVADIPVREMTPEDQVLHLCVHASHHVFEIGLRAMCDLTETLHHYQENIDWECMRRRAHLWNAGRCLYVNLWLAKELLNAPVPEEWLNSVKPADFEPRYLTLAQEHLFASAEGTENALPGSINVVRIWATESVGRKIALLWQSLFPSRQVMAMTYPVPPDSLRIFLYYPVRLKYLLQRYSGVAWHLYRGDKQMLSRAERQDQVNALKSWLLSG